MFPRYGTCHTVYVPLVYKMWHFWPNWVKMPSHLKLYIIHLLSEYCSRMRIARVDLLEDELLCGRLMHILSKLQISPSEIWTNFYRQEDILPINQNKTNQWDFSRPFLTFRQVCFYKNNHASIDVLENVHFVARKPCLQRIIQWYWEHPTTIYPLIVTYI